MSNSYRTGVICLLEAPDQAAERRCFLSYPDELLAERALATLSEVAGEATSISDESQLDRARTLLVRAQREGLLAVLAELAPVPPDTARRVDRYLNAGPWHCVFAELRANVSLLTSEPADVWMEDLLAAYRHDEAVRVQVSAARRLAEVAGVDGLDGAHRWLVENLLGQIQTGDASFEATSSLVALTARDEGWAELLDAYVDEVLTSADPRGPIETAIELIEKDVPASLRTERPIAWGSSRLALGELYLRRRGGERSYNVATALDVLTEALSTIEPGASARRSARAHYLTGSALAVQVAQDSKHALEQAVQHLAAARDGFRASGSFTDLAEAELALGHSLVELAARTPAHDERRARLRTATQVLESAVDAPLDSEKQNQIRITLARSYSAYGEFDASYSNRGYELIQSGGCPVARRTS